MVFGPVYKMIGGKSRAVTLLTVLIHGIHPLLCVANYIDWVRHQGDELGSNLVNGYIATTILSALFFLLISSVFYRWAWKYPEPEETAKRRRMYGIIGNLLVGDFPVFMVEVQIIMKVQFATPLVSVSFIFTSLSFAYSIYRVISFLMVRVSKHHHHQAPSMGGVPSSFGGGRGGFANAPYSPPR